MARYTGPVCRLSRREGTPLTRKCSRVLERKGYFPGEHGPTARLRMSEYGVQLREKQKVRRMYGVLEKQFRNYYKKASQVKGVKTGEVLLQLLERRLDNVVFRLGMAPSRNAARQLVTHGHVTINGKKVDIASCQVSQGDKVSLKEKSKGLDVVKSSIESTGEPPDWLQFNSGAVEGSVLRLPTREDAPQEIQENLIVELYSK